MQRSKINKKTLIEAIQTNVKMAIQEDIGNIDLSAQLIEAKSTAVAYVKAKESALIAGIPWFNATFLMLDPKIKIKWLVKEGEIVKKNQRLCEVYGNAKSILSGERVALNFLQTLSSTSTITHQYVKAIANTHTGIFDTRKTIPGLRIAQKYAVAIGGGNNQRIGLFDQILIKENHITSAKKVDDLLSLALKYSKSKDIQIEVENMAELQEALAAGAKNILIDNFSLEQMREAVSFTKGAALLEASGGVSLDQLKAIAATGVDRISIGKLTKDVIAVDFSLRVQ
jgi:nicotinate-nucleotide pyrophosphorylase (carboxylating)